MKSTKLLRLFLLFICLLFGHKQLQAQRVGLVLSGGGAKGAAHIGILKILEENDIPIDYITGTSMGAIVGAFYAAGYSPEEIEQMILDQNFHYWIEGEVPQEYRQFVGHEKHSPKWITFELDIDSLKNTNINTRIANDLYLNFAFNELLAQASQNANYDFDSLMVPYRAMGSEIFTEKEVSIKQGSLSKAIRASMAIPFVLKPIKIQEEYLYDGGIYNNFPVDVMEKEFQPDVLIGVNVGIKKYQEYPSDKADKLVAEPHVFLFLEKTDTTTVQSKDIYIEPQVMQYNAASFNSIPAIIDSGYVAGSKKIEELKKKIKRRQSHQEKQALRKAFRGKLKELRFDAVHIEGIHNYQKKYVYKLFNKSKDYYTLEDIKIGYYRLISENYFQNVFPSFEYNEETGLFEFHLNIQSTKDYYLNIGGVLTSRSINNLYLGLEHTRLTNVLTKYELSGYSGSFYNSFHMSSKIHFPGKRLYLLEGGFNFNRFDFLNSEELHFDDDPPPYVVSTDQYVFLNFNYPLTDHRTFQFSSHYFLNEDTYLQNNKADISKKPTLLSLQGLKLGVEVFRNTLNRVQFPSSGNYHSLKLNYFYANETYNPGSEIENNFNIFTNSLQKHQWLTAHLNIQKYKRLNPKMTYGILLDAQLSTQPVFTDYFGSLINTQGFTPLNDSRTLFLENFKAVNYAAGGMKGIYQFDHNIEWHSGLYFFKPFDQLEEAPNSITPIRNTETELLSSYMIFSNSLVYHSPVGPLSVNVNYYDNPRHTFGVFVQFGYLLFNRRSLE